MTDIDYDKILNSQMGFEQRKKEQTPVNTKDGMGFYNPAIMGNPIMFSYNIEYITDSGILKQKVYTVTAPDDQSARIKAGELFRADFKTLRLE